MHLGVPELLLIVLTILLLFGAKKIPEIAKRAGTGLQRVQES